MITHNVKNISKGEETPPQQTYNNESKTNFCKIYLR